VNFLSLCKEVARQSGISDAAPSTVVGQTGEQLRVVNWTAEAWREIQRSDLKQWGRYWRFMLQPFSATLASAANTFSMDSTVDLPMKNSFYAYKTADGRTEANPLEWCDWEEFRDIYEFTDDTDIPAVITQKPDLTMKVYPKANDAYTIEYEALIKPVTLAANADEPACLERFQWAIIWLATMKHAAHMENPAAFETAGGEYQRLLIDMQETELTHSWVTVVPE
jgi:hypothetical protein